MSPTPTPENLASAIHSIVLAIAQNDNSHLIDALETLGYSLAHSTAYATDDDTALRAEA